MIRRVAVLGCGGAGKTVLARRLGDALGLPVIHGGLHPDSGVADFLNWEFVRWILEFRRRHRPRIIELLEGHASSTQIAIVRTHAESDALVSSWAAG